MILNATRKGLVTGTLMILAGLILSALKTPDNSPLHYIGYILYGIGIVWAIYPSKNKATFGALFNEGFRCFVVATLLMVVYTWIFWAANPKEMDETVAKQKEIQLKTPGDRTPLEIDQQAKDTRKYFIPMVIAGTVFDFLLIGVVVTTAVAGTLSLSKKN